MIRQHLLWIALLPGSAWGANRDLPDLPEKGYVLLESKLPSEPDVRFISFQEHGYLVLKSSLSAQWNKGIYINLKNGRLTVPGVGAADLIGHDRGYSWTTKTQDPAFSKEGSISLTRMAEGCEMVWNFSVRSRGQSLVNESGRLAYTCSTGAAQSRLAGKQ